MNENTDPGSLFIAVLLIIAGTLSPSNGVDDSVNKTPSELLTTMLFIVLTALSAYFIRSWIEKHNEDLKQNFR